MPRVPRRDMFGVATHAGEGFGVPPGRGRLEMERGSTAASYTSDSGPLGGGCWGRGAELCVLLGGRSRIGETDRLGGKGWV